MNSNIILEVRNLKKHFKIRRNQAVRAVDGVSFSIQKGKTLGLVGESGCGKSTLGRTIIRVYEPSAGEVFINGKEISGKSTLKMRRELAQKIQMIYQDPFASLNPRMTVSDIIAEGWDVLNLEKASSPQRKNEVVRLLKTVGLNEEHANRFPHEFSGGQRQRVGIARALSVDPEILICDEPISSLDVSIQAQIMNLLMTLQREKNLTFLFIAHDLSMVRYISDEVAVMYLGNIVEQASNQELYSKPQHPYTKALFSAVPVANPRIERARTRIPLEGEVPSPLHPPKGCVFNTRCKYASEICYCEKPQLKEIAPGHKAACHLFNSTY